MWKFFSSDKKDKITELQNNNYELNLSIEKINMHKNKLEVELNKLKEENLKLKEELKLNNEIIDNLYTDDDTNLVKQYKLKLIDLNKYKEKTNNKILTLEEYNTTLRNELCNLRTKYDKMTKLSNYRKERNDKLENKLDKHE